MQNIKLTGTPKQIAWAESIRKDNQFAIQSAKKLMNEIIARTTDGGKTNLACKSALAKIEEIESEASAAWWIENGKMDHDCLMQNSPLKKLNDASVLADIPTKVKAIINAVK